MQIRFKNLKNKIKIIVTEPQRNAAPTPSKFDVKHQ
jgi:hypothetical protein